MTKSILATLLASLVFTSTVTAKEISSKLVETEIEKEHIGIQLSFGGVDTKLKGYHGKGSIFSARFALQPLIERYNWPVNVYGKISHQISKEENKTADSFYDETELVFGFEYDLLDKKSNIFAELGDIKQNFKQGNVMEWQDYGSVYRLGFNSSNGHINFKVALEHRGGYESATGYSYAFTTLDDLFSLSYKNIGDYKSIALNINSKF